MRKYIILLLLAILHMLFVSCTSSQDTPEMEQVIVITKWVNHDVINGVPSQTRIIFTSMSQMTVVVDSEKDDIGAFGLDGLEFCRYTRDGNKLTTKINNKDVIGAIEGDTITFTYNDNGVKKNVVFTKIK